MRRIIDFLFSPVCAFAAVEALDFATVNAVTGCSERDSHGTTYYLPVPMRTVQVSTLKSLTRL